MNSTEPEGQTDGHGEEDVELEEEDREAQDGKNWSEEEKPIFTEGLRRSKRQVRFHISFTSHTPTYMHTDGLRGTCTVADVTMKTSEQIYENTIYISQKNKSHDAKCLYTFSGRS